MYFICLHFSPVVFHCYLVFVLLPEVNCTLLCPFCPSCIKGSPLHLKHHQRTQTPSYLYFVFSPLTSTSYKLEVQYVIRSLNAISTTIYMMFFLNYFNKKARIKPNLSCACNPKFNRSVPSPVCKIKRFFYTITVMHIYINIENTSMIL